MGFFLGTDVPSLTEIASEFTEDAWTEDDFLPEDWQDWQDEREIEMAYFAPSEFEVDTAWDCDGAY